MYKRTNQGGSVAGFVVVAIILVALVGGGVYLVNQRQSSEVATQPGASNGNQSQENSDQQGAGAPSGSNNSQQGASGGTNSGGSGSGNGSTPTGTPNQAATPTTGTGHLPTTGIVDDGLRILAVALLIGTATAYVRSVMQKQQPSL